MLTGVKSLLKSTTIRALIVAALAKVTGDALSPDMLGQGYELLVQSVDLVAEIVSYAALAVAGWGRVKATEKITLGGAK